MDENSANTEPSDSLAPLPRKLAIAASAPAAPARLTSGRLSVRDTLCDLLDAVLDRLDVAADRIADAAGLR